MDIIENRWNIEVYPLKGFGTSRARAAGRFIEEAEDVSGELLPRLEALDLHQERVLLCSREQRHFEAL